MDRLRGRVVDVIDEGGWGEEWTLRREEWTLRGAEWTLRGEEWTLRGEEWSLKGEEKNGGPWRLGGSAREAIREGRKGCFEDISRRESWGGRRIGVEGARSTWMELEESVRELSESDRVRTPGELRGGARIVFSLVKDRRDCAMDIAIATGEEEQGSKREERVGLLLFQSIAAPSRGRRWNANPGEALRAFPRSQHRG
ncbi:hypothetical protein KM043_004471 [Ampulex compressa]|nr:hypothetical protein KM043_004471 [Ampulex compressa]